MHRRRKNDFKKFAKPINLCSLEFCLGVFVFLFANFAYFVNRRFAGRVFRLVQCADSASRAGQDTQGV